MLHSCSPNLIVDVKTQSYYASRDIKPNEYLSIDYELTEDDLHSHFECRCGQKNCRGMIRGRKYVNMKNNKVEEKSFSKEKCSMDAK